jgi:hypothetical protein
MVEVRHGYDGFGKESRIRFVYQHGDQSTTIVPIVHSERPAVGQVPDRELVSICNRHAVIEFEIEILAFGISFPRDDNTCYSRGKNSILIIEGGIPLI